MNGWKRNETSPGAIPLFASTLSAESENGSRRPSKMGFPRLFVDCVMAIPGVD
jgi:hypothetical protein